MPLKGERKNARVQPSDVSAYPTHVASALLAAWQIQEWIVNRPVQTTPYGSFAFAVKQGMASGELIWQTINQMAPKVTSAHLHYYSGSAIIEATTAETQAQPGQLVVTTAIADLLLDHIQTVSVGGFWQVTAVADTITQLAAKITPLSAPPPLPIGSQAQPAGTTGAEAHGYWCWSSALSHQGKHAAAYEMG